jgi:branched-chain amino acid transport system ATP-binding protein
MEAVEVRYGAAVAVQGVSFEVRDGSVLTMLGANGAGKSSLARACCGLVPAAKGQVTLDGVDITRWPADRIRKAGLVYLPEGRGIFPNLTVLENLRLAVRLEPNRRDALDHAIELFPVLGERKSQRAGSLSGGEQQMLSLARALSISPRVVIVDEPSLGLSPRMVDYVFDGLSRAKKLGRSLVLIEQFAHRALALSDECLILQRGEVAWRGRASDAQERLAEHYLGTQGQATGLKQEG